MAQTVVFSLMFVHNCESCIFMNFSICGDVRLWDIRMKESFKVINTAAGLTAMDAHQHAELIAWSVHNVHDCLSVKGQFPYRLITFIITEIYHCQGE